MVLSLRGESMELDPIIAFWDKVAERFSESMTRWVDQFVEGMKQPQPKSDTKHDRKVLICGYTQEEDCVCEATEIVESEYDVDDTIMDLKEDEMNSWTGNGETTGDENGDPIVTEISDYNDLLKKTEVPSPPNHSVCDQFTHSKFLLEINFFSLGSADSTVRGMFCANKKELIIANEVFDKNPQRRGYMEVLNPEPPDDYGPIIQGTIVTTCVQTVVNNLDDAHELINNAISIALTESKPVYNNISCNLPGIPHPTIAREPVSYFLTPKVSNQLGSEATLVAAVEFLNKAVKPVIVGGPKLSLANAQEAFEEFANVCGYLTLVHIQEILSGDTIVIVEMGESWFNCQKLFLPKNCSYEFQMKYGSIRWSVGATFGYAQAAKDKRVIAFIGDRSFQVTAQDITAMILCGQCTVIFLINNGVNCCLRHHGELNSYHQKPVVTTVANNQNGHHVMHYCLTHLYNKYNILLLDNIVYNGCVEHIFFSGEPEAFMMKLLFVWNPMVALTESICWKVVAKSFPSTGIGIVIYQKLVSSSCYERHNDNVLLLCKPVWAIQIRKFARISPRSTMIRLARGMLKLYECYMLDQLKCMDGCHLYVPWNSASLVVMRIGHTKVVWHLYNNIMECCVVWFIQNSIVWMVLQSHWNYWDNLMGLGMKAICTKEVLTDDQRKYGPPRKVKWWYSTFYTVKVLVGAGFLSLSYVMAYLRWGPGTEFMIILSWCSTLYIMGQRIQLHECVSAVHFDCYHNSSQYTCGEQVILQFGNFSDGGNKVFVTMSFGCNLCVLNLFLEFYGGIGSNVENTKAQAHTDYDIGITRTDSNHKLVAYTKGAQGDEIFIAHTINGEADTIIGKLLVGVTYGLVDNISARSIIMQNVSQGSVVVMDELGRATSFDGFAIAWSCCVKILHFYVDEKNNRMGFNFRLKDGLRHVPHYGLLLAGVVGLSGSVIDIARSITSKITTKEMKRLEVNFEQYHGNDFHGFKLSSKLLVFPP